MQGKDGKWTISEWEGNEEKRVEFHAQPTPVHSVALFAAAPSAIISRTIYRTAPDYTHTLHNAQTRQGKERQRDREAACTVLQVFPYPQGRPKPDQKMDIDSPSDKQTQSRDDEGSERMEGNSVHGTNEARERSDREDGEDEDEDEVEFDSPVNSFSGMLDGEEPLLPDSPLLGEALDGAPARTSSVQDGSNSQQGNSDDGQEGSDASDSDPDEEDEEEEQVRGLTVSEREILTLLAVDKVSGRAPWITVGGSGSSQDVDNEVCVCVCSGSH